MGIGLAVARVGPPGLVGEGRVRQVRTEEILDLLKREHDGVGVPLLQVVEQPAVLAKVGSG